MRAVQFRSYGSPQNVQIDDVPGPQAGGGRIRIAVRAASVNPIDWKLLSGAMAGGKPLDGVGRLGVDASGVVDQVGPDVAGVELGDEVFGIGEGTYAESALLTAWAAKPASVDWPVAAAVGVAGETSERCLRLLGAQSGDTVFIDGGAGGVGAVAVQYALAHGLSVIASAGEDNQNYLRSLGATPVRYGDGVVARVREAAGGEVDGVLDVAGQTPVEQLIGLVSDPSRVVSIANFGAAQAGIQVTGGGQDANPQQALAEIARLLADGRLEVTVRTFPLADAAEALAISQGGHVRGKLVLLP